MVRPADELVRVVRTEAGGLTVDRSGPGRGAWLCAGSLDCLDRAVRRHGFDRAFATAIDGAEVGCLQAELTAAWGQVTPDVRG
jgi:predicted RNA-binding protein YlxR (DUF448 family)